MVDAVVPSDAIANRVAIVIPCLNDVPSTERLISEVSKMPLPGSMTPTFVVVDDGSTPPAASELPRFSGGGIGSILTLKRNVGHQRAIAIGVSFALANRMGRIIAVMDGDGEDRPEDLQRLLDAALSHDGYTIAVAERMQRSESRAFRTFYAIYRLLFMLTTGLAIRFGNFSAMQLPAATRLTEMGEMWINLPATMLRSRLRLHKVPTSRGKRYFGSSRMNLVSLIVHGFSAVAVFYERALTRLFVAGLSLLGLTLLASCVAILLKLLDLASPGWLSTVIGISLIILVTTATLCFLNIIASITGAAQAVTPPSEIYGRYIARVDGFGSNNDGLCNAYHPLVIERES